MTFEHLRQFCFTLPGVCETMPFAHLSDRYNRQIVCFCTGDKWFALLNCAAEDFCNIKCDPQRSLELQELYEGVTPGWHMNKKHWISVHFDSDVPDELFCTLLKDAYELVVASLPRRKQEAIRTMPTGGLPPELEWTPPLARKR